MTRDSTHNTTGPIDKYKVIYAAGKGGNLRVTLPLLHLDTNVSSGAYTDGIRVPLATTTGGSPVVVPADFVIDEIKMTIMEQGAGTTKIDVHVSSGTTHTSIFGNKSTRPYVSGTVSIASGATGCNIGDGVPTQTQLYEDNILYTFVDESATGPSGLYVVAVGRTTD